MRPLVRPLVFVLLLVTLTACTSAAVPPAPSPTARPTAAPATDTPTPTATEPPAATPATTEPPPTPTATKTPILAIDDLPVSDEVSLELVSQFGGSVASVAVAGDVAFFGVGPHLVALDAAALPTIREIGRSERLPGGVRAVIAVDGVAYVGAGKTVTALDVADPAAMQALASAQLPGPATDLTLSDSGMLYAAGITYADWDADPHVFESHVTALDTADDLAILSTRTLADAVEQVVWVNDTLYSAARSRSSLWTFPTGQGDPLGEPAAVMDDLEDVASLTAYGDVLLVGDYVKMVALDISQPLAPARLWETDSFEVGIATGAAASGGSIYTIGFQPAGGYVPAHWVFAPPEPLPTEEPAIASVDAAIYGTYLLAAEPALNVYALDSVGTEARWEPVATFSGPPSVHNVAISGSTLVFDEFREYVSAEADDVYALSLPDLSPAGVLDFDGSTHIRGIAAESSRIYLAAETGELYTASVEAGAAPTLLGVQKVTDWFDWAKKPVATGGRLYVTGPNDVVLSFDVVNPDTPVEVGRFQPTNQITALAAGGANVYALSHIQLAILDAASMDWLGAVTLPGLRDIDAEGDLAAVASAAKGLFLIEASDPDDPEIVGQLGFAGAYGVALAGDLAFVQAQATPYTPGVILVVDISDPAAPRAVGSVESPLSSDWMGGLAVWEDHLIAYSPNAGITVYRVVKE